MSDAAGDVTMGEPDPTSTNTGPGKAQKKQKRAAEKAQMA